MKTWDEYKDYVKSIDKESKNELEQIEAIASIVGEIVRQRKTLGISQRELARLCGIPQSSVARIESLKTTPNLDTLVKITNSLGLEIKISSIAN